MLHAECAWQETHLNDLALSAGDYNGSAEENCYCRGLYKKFPFTDTIAEPIFGEHKLDHVYISEKLKSSDISVTTKVMSDYYLQFSDHKMISITLTKE